MFWLQCAPHDEPDLGLNKSTIFSLSRENWPSDLSTSSGSFKAGRFKISTDATCLKKSVPVSYMSWSSNLCSVKRALNTVCSVVLTGAQLTGKSPGFCPKKPPPCSSQTCIALHQGFQGRMEAPLRGLQPVTQERMQ